MNIDWAGFTPWSALAGGALIGLAAAIFALANGRVAGISGLLGSLLQPGAEGRGEKALFLLGLLLAPLLLGLFCALPAISFDGGALSLIGAGSLVGIGTRYGSGCTSGHGGNAEKLRPSCHVWRRPQAAVAVHAWRERHGGRGGGARRRRL